jgi:shikimate kinase
MGDRQARLAELLEERRPFYAGADLRIVTDSRSPAQVVDAIAFALGIG